MIHTLKCRWTGLALLACLGLAGIAQAQETLTVTGTGPSAGISFQIPVTPTSILQGGLNSTFNVTATSLPAGVTCGVGTCQAAYGAPGGQIRLSTTAPGPTYTWFFPQFIHAGVYTTPGNAGAGEEAGILVVSGIDATAGNPQSNPLSTGFQAPLEVTATTPALAYASGITVTFTAPGSGPSATFAGGINTATTDSSGRARITPAANGTAGAYQIVASATVNSVGVQFPFVLANVNTANAVGACQVTTGNDDFSSGSLRYQIAACGKGGTITFGGGVTTVNVSAFQDIPLTQDITIDGGGTVTLSGQSSRVFFITGGTISLKNLTISSSATSGGMGGVGLNGGGGGAGMGGAIFQNGGSLLINAVSFSSNTASGGGGGSGGASFGASSGAGGGFSGLYGGVGVSTPGNGGGGGDLEGSGGAGSSASSGGGGGSGAGGGGGLAAGGSGGFGGGGGASASGSAGANGGFGGGAAGSGTAGAFGGAGSTGGGGGAGLGGAIFVNSGTLSLVNATFGSNTASRGAAGTGASNGQGKGGALFINSGATATYSGTAPVFSNNAADDGGINTPCNSVVGAGALDTADVCGVLSSANATHFSISAVTPAAAGTASNFTVTALNASNATDTGYTGTVHFTSSDGGAVLPANYTFVVGDAGVHTFTGGVTFQTAGTQTITATGTGNSAITGTSNNVTVTPGPVHSMTVSGASPQVPGVAFNLTVTVKDQFNNAITSSADTFTYTSSDGAATLPSAGAFTSSTVPVTLNTKGNQTITVTDTTLSVTGQSNTIQVTAQPATLAAAFNPTSGTVGGSSSLTITVTNPNSIALNHVAFSLTMPSGLTLVTETGGTCGTLGGTGGGSTNLNPGAGTFSSSSNAIAGGASCNVVLRVTGSATGAHMLTTSTVTSDQSISAGTAASATLTVNSPPTLSETFAPTSIQRGQSSTLTFHVTNTDSTAAATGVAFSDTLPAGMTIDSPNGLTGSCGGGTITATAGSGSLALSAATLAASASCTFSVSVVTNGPGSFINTTGAPSSTNDGTGSAASATLTVTSAPSLTESFTPSSIKAGQSSTLAFTVTNTDSTTTATGVAFSDTLPAGMTINSPNGLTGSCGGGTITATAGSGSLTLSGATLAASASCTFSVSVVTSGPGSFMNTTGAPSSTNEGTGSAASGTLTVTSAPALSESFTPASINTGQSSAIGFTLTNTDNTTAVTGVGFSDALPSGMTISSPNGLTGSCGGGAITAIAGSNSLTLSGATLAASATCTFSVSVVTSSVGIFTNTTSTVSTANEGTGLAASATLTVAAAPTLGKAFGAATIPVNGTTSLTFTIANPNVTTALTGIGFTDSFPTGMSVANPNGLSGSCGGGSIAAAPGSGSVSLSGASLAGGASCMFSINVTANAAGTYNNVSGAITATNGVAGALTGITASSGLSVLAPPSLSKSFGASNIPVNGTTSLTFALSNPNPSVALTGVGFTDTFPAGLTIATPSGLTGSCGGGTIGATTGGASVTLSGATLAGGGSCTFSVNVTAGAGGTYNNTTGQPASANGGLGNSASATLTVAVAVTLQTSPPGLSVTVDNVTQTSPAIFQLAPASQHTISVASPQAGGAGTQYAFASWSDSGAQSHTITVPASASTYTATFTTQYLLTTSANGGTISPPTGYFNAGSTVTITATASSGFHFAGWSGPITPASSGAGTVVMNGPQSVTALFALDSSGTVTPPVVNLIDYIGGGGTSVLSGSFTVTTADGKGFTLDGSAPWLNIGVSGNSVNVSVNTASLTSNFSASLKLTFTFADGTTQSGLVNLQAVAPGQFVLPSGVTGLTFTAVAGSTGTLSQTITVAGAGSNIAAQASASTTNGGNWLSVTGGGVTPQSFTITANPSGLAPGTYQGSVTVTSTTPGTNPLVIPVTLIVTAPAGITVSSFDNAGSLQSTPAAPNTIFTAFGVFPGCTPGAQVTVDGNPTSVFYSSPTQINFLIPASVAGEANTSVVIGCAGLSSASISLPVAAAAPALFTVNQSGAGQADSVNQDNSIDAPVPAGSVIQLYGTGFGVYAPVSADGLTGLVQTVTATIGGVPAQVLFAGQAPGYTSGLQQLDVVPSGLAPGSTQPLVLNIGGVTTQMGLTLTIASGSSN